MHNAKQKNRSGVVRNAHAFIKAYLGSESGIRALNRKPSWDKVKGMGPVGAGQIANAFLKAINNAKGA